MLGDEEADEFMKHLISRVGRRNADRPWIGYKKHLLGKFTRIHRAENEGRDASISEHVPYAGKIDTVAFVELFGAVDVLRMAGMQRYPLHPGLQIGIVGPGNMNVRAGME